MAIYCLRPFQLRCDARTVRHYLISYLDSRPKPLARRALREQRALMRGQLLRANGRYLSLPEYEARRETLIKAYTDGVYLAKKPSENGEASEAEAPPNPLDPAAMEGMIGMVKKQAVLFGMYSLVAIGHS